MSTRTVDSPAACIKAAAKHPDGTAWTHEWRTIAARWAAILSAVKTRSAVGYLGKKGERNRWFSGRSIGRSPETDCWTKTRSSLVNITRFLSPLFEFDSFLPFFFFLSFLSIFPFTSFALVYRWLHKRGTWLSRLLFFSFYLDTIHFVRTPDNIFASRIKNSRKSLITDF